MGNEDGAHLFDKRELLSEAGRKALQILKQPPPKIQRGTDYERPSTPYFIDASAQSPEYVRIVISLSRHYGSFYGDSNHWERSERCDIPAVSFYEALTKLEPGKEVSMQLRADIVTTDSAWGVDCDNPHDIVSHQEEQILLYIRILEDMKTVSLKLLRQEADFFIPYAQLTQTENIPAPLK